MNACIFIPAVVGLFAAALGYFLGRLFSSQNDTKYLKLIEDFKTKVVHSEQIINQLNKNIIDLNEVNQRLDGSLFASNQTETNYKSKIASLEEKLANNQPVNVQELRTKIVDLETKLAAMPTTNNAALLPKVSDLESKLREALSKEAILQQHIEQLKNVPSNLETEQNLKQHINLLEQRLKNVNLTDNQSLNRINDLELQVANGQKQIDYLQSKNDELLVAQKTLTIDTESSWQNKIAEYEDEIVRLRQLIEIKSGNLFDAINATNILGKKVKQDDLKLVEGIGPKIEELFHQANILTWEQLANTTVEQCQVILNSAGERYRIHNPSTWPKQCKLMHQGKWEELKIWQQHLKSGLDK